MEDGAPVFSADVHMLRAGGECMEGFIQQAEREDWKYGDFVSGCAVRLDAAHILDRVRQTVSRITLCIQSSSLIYLPSSNFEM